MPSHGVGLYGGISRETKMVVAPLSEPPIDVAAPSAPTPSVSSNPSVVRGVTREQVFGGCGGRRIRDPQTNQCRGPADVGR
jgi:hypothetical protein